MQAGNSAATSVTTPPEAGPSLAGAMLPRGLGRWRLALWPLTALILTTSGLVLSLALEHDLDRARPGASALYLAQLVVLAMAVLLLAWRVRVRMGIDRSRVAELPVSPEAAPAAELEVRPAEEPTRAAFLSPRVLLVDDSPVGRKAASRLLERAGFEVAQAVDGRDALAIWEQGRFDLVLMDVQMPEMDGLEATRAMRGHERERGRPRTPVIALTAHSLADDQAAARESGMDGFVIKPVRLQALLEEIRRVTGYLPGEAAAGPAAVGLRDVLDWNEALERMGGDEPTLRHILGLFLQDSAGMAQRFEEARASGDAVRIERAAHSLKGASATISANTVSLLAREIEGMAREGNLPAALERLPDLNREWDRLLQALTAESSAAHLAA